MYIALLLAAVALSGCTAMAPEYRPSYESAQDFRDAGSGKVAVGQFKADKDDEPAVTEMRLRGSSMESPYGSYSAYLKHALERQLQESQRLDPSSDAVVSGVLLKNAVDINGFSVGTSSMKARFMVHRGGKPIYDKVHAAQHEWPSSFTGVTAFEALFSNYHVTVQKLIASLFGDKEFQAAVK
ncbi:MAG TPA: hypothetical protein VFY81_03205 [Gammaproteobacteria bacterium]|nr:hypothetical protein [Gammaproteobacteria bacterium]